MASFSCVILAELRIFSLRRHAGGGRVSRGKFSPKPAKCARFNVFPHIAHQPQIGRAHV
jgi:hypothetical protein